MDHTRRARTNLHRCDPGILFERGGNGQLFPFLNAGGGNRIGREINRHVRLDIPAAFGPLHGWRRIRRFARRRAGIDPGHNRVNLRLLQRAVIIKMSVFGIGEPGRHFLCGDVGLDGCGPGTGALIVEEGKRANLSRPVATLAMLLNDGQHILVEGGRRVAGRPVAGRRLGDRCFGDGGVASLSRGARRFCRPNSSAKRQPDGRQSDNTLRHHVATS